MYNNTQCHVFYFPRSDVLHHKQKVISLLLLKTSVQPKVNCSNNDVEFL